MSPDTPPSLGPLAYHLKGLVREVSRLAWSAFGTHVSLLLAIACLGFAALSIHEWAVLLNLFAAAFNLAVWLALRRAARRAAA